MNKFFSAAMMMMTAAAMTALGAGCASADPSESDSVSEDQSGQFANDAWRRSCWGGDPAECVEVFSGTSQENYSLAALKRACDALAAQIGPIAASKSDGLITFANGRTALCSSLNATTVTASPVRGGTAVAAAPVAAAPVAQVGAVSAR